MTSTNILRWILFLPAAFATLFVSQFIEKYLTILAISHDNFIMKWIIAIAYSFFAPIIIVLVGVGIVPKYKSIISKLLSTSLILLLSYAIYITSVESGDFLEYFSFTISILGCIITFIVGGQEKLE